MEKYIYNAACIHPLARIADDVKTGAFSIIYQNIELASGYEIGGYCEFGIKTPLSDGSPLNYWGKRFNYIPVYFL